jgi:opacity protein-like surface antigen
MKNFLAAGCALAKSVFPAMAADMLLKTPLPPPAPVTWTGCYLGGSLGGIWRTTDNVSIGVVDGGSGVGAAVTAGAIPTAFDAGGLGWIAGGQTGCNYQAGSWVIGIETDFSSGYNASATVTTNVPPFLPLTSSVSQDMSWIGTTRGRLGWAWGNVLLYATGGVAYANTSYAYALGNFAGGGTTTAAASDSATSLAGPRAAASNGASGRGRSRASTSITTSAATPSRRPAARSSAAALAPRRQCSPPISTTPAPSPGSG